MAIVKFRSIKPGTVIGISEAIGSIGFALGAVCIIFGIFGKAPLLLFGLAAFGSGLATLLGVILVRTMLQIAESNARIVLELENL